jgi:ubiquitin carboxyl-terminal hydrolase 7
MGSNDRVVQVIHFSKDPGHQHGIPFKFVIKAVSLDSGAQISYELSMNADHHTSQFLQDETFADTKKRLQARLGMNDKDFTKVRVVIVSPTASYSRPMPVEEGNVF